MSATIRRAVASLAAVALGIRFFLLFHDGVDRSHEQAWALFGDFTTAVPFVAAALIWSRRLAAQLLARAAWWSMLLGATLVAVIAPNPVQALAAFTAGLSALALVAAGDTGLADHPQFAPVAFRRTLLVALVLAIADAGAFSWVGIGNAVFDHSWSVLVMVPLMVAGVIGLLRLRTWGLLVSLTTNAAIAVLALTNVLHLGPMRALFIGSAVVQMMVPIPMIVAIIRKRPARASSWRRTRAIAPMVIVGAIAALAFYAYVNGGPLVRV